MNDAPPPTEATTTSKDVGSVVNAFEILRFLAGSTVPYGTAAIARATGISPSTAFTILRTLVRLRMVTLHEVNKTYSLGIAIDELAFGMIGLNHSDMIRPELERLALNYPTMIGLWRVTEDAHIVLLDRAFQPSTIRLDMAVGQRLPALAGAVGRCIAAVSDFSEQELRRRFAGLRWQTPMDFDTYLAQIAETRERGWAADLRQLYNGVDSVAAVICDSSGKPRYAVNGITIAGQISPQDFDRLGQDVCETTRLIERSLFPAKSTPG